jgi:5'-nucleotidase
MRITAALCPVLVLAIALLIAVSPVTGIPQMAAPEDSESVHVKILAINDFHGHLYEGQNLNNRSAGSAPVLASRLRSAIGESPASATLLVLTGDTVGASPRNTSLLMDEPSILYFNQFANADCRADGTAGQGRCNVIAIPGNHEFNRGTDELLRMTYGGNGDIPIPRVADPYPGSLADTICANVVWKENKTPILPPYTIREVGGVPVAFIGAVTLETQILELPMNIESVEFQNESESINRYVALLKAQGVHAFVILLHEGADQEDAFEGPTRPGGNVTGPAAPIIARLDPDVDVVLAGHWHRFTNAYVKNAGGNDVLLTQADAYGMAYADVDLLIDRTSGDIVEKSAVIVPVYADDPAGTGPDPAASALVAEVQTAVSRMEREVIARAASDITRDHRIAGGSALGVLVADSQRAAMDADVAFVITGTSAGSLQTDIDEGEITWADLERVLPSDASMAAQYGGWYSRPRVATRELTEDQIRKILERQWEEPAPEGGLSVSGLEYTFDLSRPVGDRVTGMSINSEPVSPGVNYTAAMNYYLAYGRGDYAPAWDWGEVVVIGPADVDALAGYIRSRPEKWTR